MYQFWGLEVGIAGPYNSKQQIVRSTVSCDTERCWCKHVVLNGI